MSELPPNAGRHEQVPEPNTPRVYVASLSDYNAGRLHGSWLDLGGDVETMWEGVRQMLAISTEPVAEEWAIHDYENFGPLQLGEYEDLERVHAIAEGICEHGEAFAHWAALLDRAEWDQLLPQFDDHYQGSWESLEAFAEQLLDDLGIDFDELGPEHLQPYISFDLEAFARDLSFDYRISEGTGGAHIFDY